MRRPLHVGDPSIHHADSKYPTMSYNNEETNTPITQGLKFRFQKRRVVKKNDSTLCLIIDELRERSKEFRRFPKGTEYPILQTFTRRLVLSGIDVSLTPHQTSNVT